jgi:flagellar hook assembly protein FlgD
LGDTVTLSGTDSADPDGDELTYLWQFDSTPQASNSNLENPTSVTPTFIGDVVGDFVVLLVVNDGEIDSAADPVTITITDTNHAPIANAGEDITANAGDTITLSGALSTDADGDSLSYAWQFVSQPSGSAANIRNQTAQSPSFIVDLSGSYIVSLTVNDGWVDSEVDEVTVTVSPSNNAPVAEAGASQLTTVGQTVTFSEASSTDEDGDSLTYAWQIDSKPGTSTAELTNATSVSPYLLADIDGSYVISLTVNDDLLDSTADTVTLSAQATTALADGQTSVGTFGINSIDATQAFSAPCSKDPISNAYTVTLYALSNEVGSLPLEASSADLSTLTDAILTTTLASATIELSRIRYNPNNDDHVPSSVPSDCESKSAAFAAHSDLVSVICGSTTMTITSKTLLPYRSSLDGDKPNVGIKSWIGRVAIAEETSWTLPLQPSYLSSTQSNINIHDAIDVSVEGVPIFHYGEDYHYHTAPLCLMDTHDPSLPLAYMFDGIPLYFGTGGGVLTTDGSDDTVSTHCR